MNIHLRKFSKIFDMETKDLNKLKVILAEKNRMNKWFA